MRIMMLGWEFPPFIAGGLGTACYGLTKALDRLGHEVVFVLPRPVDRSHASHVRLLSPEQIRSLNWTPPAPGAPAPNGRKSPAAFASARAAIDASLIGAEAYTMLIVLHGCGDNTKNFATWAAAPYVTRQNQNYLAVSVGGRDGQCCHGDKTARGYCFSRGGHGRSPGAVHRHRWALG